MVQVRAVILYRSQREKTYFLICEPNDDSDQPAHPRSHRCPHEETLNSLLSNIQGRFWSECAVDLNLPWTHIVSEGTSSDVAAYMI